MPASYSSPARNFFLIGSSGDDTITNFFRGVDKSAASYNSFTTTDIQFNGATGLVQEYGISGWKHDSTSSAQAKEHGWIENRTFNLETFATSTIFDATISSTIQSNARVNDILFTNGFIYACGYAGDTDFIAKYNESSGAVIDFSTSNTGDNRHTKLTVDPDGNIYCAGYTENGDMTVVKYDSNTIPIWSKVIDSWNDSKLESIALAKDGNPIAVGWVGDESYHNGSDKVKGYILKLNKVTGDYLWDRTLEDNLARGSFNYVCDSYISDVTFNDDGEMFVVGFKVRYQEADSGFIVKYDEVGNMMWQSTSSYTTDPNPKTIHYRRVKTDSDTGQTITVGEIFPDTNVGGNQSNGAVLLSKYSSAGQLLWRREVESNNSQEVYEGIAMDADSTFYYLVYTDESESLTNSTPDRYVFGKVSTSGNGLGAFQYDDQEGVNIDYTYNDCADQIGKLSDGSVRNDTSDLITYPFTATKLVFDDLATQVQNKKAQIARAGTFQMSGSPAIRVTDFQELNLLGDVAPIPGTPTTTSTTITETWSSYVSNGSTGDRAPSTAFNGSIANNTGYSETNWTRSASNGNTPAVLDVSSIALMGSVTEVKVYAYVADSQNNGTILAVNDVNQATSGQSGFQVYTVDVSGTGLETIKYKYISGSGPYCYLTGVTVSINGGSHIELIDGTAITGNISSTGPETWQDQSGNGNDGVGGVTTTTTTTTGGTTVSENFGTGGSITYNTYGTVVEGATASSLPYSTSDWDHYNSKVRDLQNGGFKITTTNSATTDFFMGCWVKIENYSQSRQMGINLSGNYIYWETLVDGKVGIRHNGGSRQDSTSGTGINDLDWHYISLSRSGNTLAGHVDGATVISTTNGVSGNSVPSNADFWFFGGSGTSYNIDGKILDPIINIGSGQTGSYTAPTKPIIDSSGNFNDGSSGTGPFFNNTWDYASPAIALAGSTTTTTTTTAPTYNAAGYFDFDGTDDKITLGTTPLIGSNSDFTIEGWCWVDALTTECTIFEISSGTSSASILLSAGGNFDGTVGGRFFVRKDSGQDLGMRNPPNLGHSTGEWHHYVGTHINSSSRLFTTKLYVDGVNVQAADTFAPSWDFTFSSVNTQQLGLSSGDRFLDGRIGEFRIYPRALTAAQVFQNYNATKSQYINEAPDTAPKISPGIVIDSDLILNYDFGNRATYDRAENLFKNNSFVDRLDYNSTTNGNWAFSSGPTNSTVGPNVLSPVGDLTGGTAVYDGTDASAGGIAWSYKDTAASSDQNQVQFVDGDVVTYSVYAKIGSSNNAIKGIYLRTYSPETAHVFYLNTGTKAGGFSENTAAAGISADIVDAGNGWYRCSITMNITANDEIGFQLYLTNAGGSTGFNDASGAGDTIHAWGAQVERNSSAGRHIRTYGSAITAPTTVKNLSSDTDNGTLVNGVTFNSDGHFDFGGVDGKIETALASSAIGNTFSAEVWIYPTDFSAPSGSPTDAYPRRILTCHRSVGSTKWCLGIDTSGRLGFGGAQGVEEAADKKYQLSLNTYYHVVLAHNGTSYKIYVNGTEQVDQTTSPIDTNNQSNLAISGRPDGYGDRVFEGRIAQARIYNDVLSSSEVSQNFNATRGKYGV